LDFFIKTIIATSKQANKQTSKQTSKQALSYYNHKIMSTAEEGKHVPDTTAQPVKPALVHHHHKKERKGLTWDEHAIEEHDLLRGTRMKVS
jgi:hypothetical protein